MVSDLKKEIINDVKAILSEKDNKIEVLKSQVILLQNHVSKHALDKKLMNWSSMEDRFDSTLTVLTIKLTKNLRKFWEK